MDHLLGTDNLGRSMLSRVIFGAQLSLLIGLWVVVLNAIFGVLLGAVAGYFSRLDGPLMRLADALMAFPSVLLAIGIAAALGPSTTTVVIALAVVYIPRTARILRASVLVVRETRLRAVGPRGRCLALAHPVPAHPAQQHGPADRAAEFRVRVCGVVRGGAELPGARRAADHTRAGAS
jgi:ABC-type microcin C transport system permease subunit YejE